jgi:hypothetical protein
VLARAYLREVRRSPGGGVGAGSATAAEGIHEQLASGQLGSQCAEADGPLGPAQPMPSAGNWPQLVPPGGPQPVPPGGPQLVPPGGPQLVPPGGPQLVPLGWTAACSPRVDRSLFRRADRSLFRRADRSLIPRQHVMNVTYP